MPYQNFYATKLQVQASASDTTLQVQSAPSVTSGWLVLEARNPTNREIVRFTGVSGNILTGVLRAQQGTNAVPHIAGASAEMNITAQDLQDALDVNSNIPVFITDAFGNNAGKATFASAKGLVWSNLTGLNATMTAGVVYINGVRITVPAIASRTFTASRDTYVDIKVDGTPTYVVVNNGAAEPAKTADSVRIALIVTSASAVTSIRDIRERVVKTEAITDNAVTAAKIDFTTFPSTVKLGQITITTTTTQTITGIGFKPSVVRFTLKPTTGGANNAAYGVSDGTNNYAVSMADNGSSTLFQYTSTSSIFHGNASGVGQVHFAVTMQSDGFTVIPSLVNGSTAWFYEACR